MPIRKRSETDELQKFSQRRSPEEFQIYLRTLFNTDGQYANYHWYFSRKKAKNKQNRAIYS